MRSLPAVCRASCADLQCDVVACSVCVCAGGVMMCVLGWCGGAGPDHGQFYAGKDFWDPVNKRRLFNAWAMVQETDFCAI
jgi:hypothetical protein